MAIESDDREATYYDGAEQKGNTATVCYGLDAAVEISQQMSLTPSYGKHAMSRNDCGLVFLSRSEQE